MSSAGKSSAPSPSTVRRSAAAVIGSAPGARPMPRSMRPGCSASSIANCSATTSVGWFGSMTPPEPSRMRSRRRREVREQDAGGRRRDRRHRVVLGHPEPRVAGGVGGAGEGGRRGERVAGGLADGDGRGVEHGQGHRVTTGHLVSNTRAPVRTPGVRSGVQAADLVRLGDPSDPDGQRRVAQRDALGAAPAAATARCAVTIRCSRRSSISRSVHQYAWLACTHSK